MESVRREGRPRMDCPLYVKRKRNLPESRFRTGSFYARKLDGAYFTEPVIPSVKLFCRQKKTMAVGIVQMNTPSISIP